MLLPGIDLLPKERLVRTSEIDHADWNYRPLLGKLQRTRFQLVKSLLRGVNGNDLLEVGYGSGIFFPELLKICGNISGIDPHQKHREVQEELAKAGIAADLRSGSVATMPFDDDSFDVIVAVSALEYVEAIDDACEEMKRVLRKGGLIALVTPCKSAILDAGLKLLGNEDADSNYGERRENLVAALDRHFERKSVRSWPWPGIPGFTVYRALCLVARGNREGSPASS